MRPRQQLDYELTFTVTFFDRKDHGYYIICIFFYIHSDAIHCQLIQIDEIAFFGSRILHIKLYNLLIVNYES